MIVIYLLMNFGSAFFRIFTDSINSAHNRYRGSWLHHSVPRHRTKQQQLQLVSTTLVAVFEAKQKDCFPVGTTTTHYITSLIQRVCIISLKKWTEVKTTMSQNLTLWRPLLPYGYSY